jgi:hypothetical protein
MWASTPSRRNRPLPELIEITGIPDFTARRIASSTSGLGIETTSPSGRAATAASMSARMRATLNVSGDW